MKLSTLKTELPPSSQLRKAVFRSSHPHNARFRANRALHALVALDLSSFLVFFGSAVKAIAAARLTNSASSEEFVFLS